MLDTATWRASRDWGERLGYSPEELAEANRRAVALIEELRASNPTRPCSTASSARAGTAYVVGETMTPEEAEAYHAEQIGEFAAPPTWSARSR